MKVKDLCVGCDHCTKIIDYVWDNNNKKYTEKIKGVGYLCSSPLFSKRYYRKAMDSLGRGCKGHTRVQGKLKVIHNNHILKTKKEG